ncbi:unnamed protein product, partial [Laminaria digitata]
HSYKNQSLWKAKTGKTFKSVNSVRWGAAFDCNQDIMENLVEAEEFLKDCKNSDGTPSKPAQRLKLLNDPIDGLMVKLQLAVLCRVGQVITRATYALESDSPMIEKAWDIIQTVVTLLGVDVEQLTNPVFPNMEAVICRTTDHLEGDLREHAFERFGGQVHAKFRGQMMQFKASRVIDPQFINLHADAASVSLESLLIFPFITHRDLDALNVELGTYFPIVKHLPNHNIVTKDFWLSNRTKLPAWFDLVRKLWVIQPSSAMMERALSVMNNIFGSQQKTVLNDLFELSVMLRYN